MYLGTKFCRTDYNMKLLKVPENIYKIITFRSSKKVGNLMSNLLEKTVLNNLCILKLSK